VDCTGDPGHTETLVDLHRYLVLDFEAQALLFREARMSNTSTGETVIEAQFEAVYDLLRFAPTSIIQPLRMPVMRLDEARARLLAHAWERDQEKTASALVSVVPAADLDLHEKLPVVFPHVPNVRNPFADPVARAESAQFIAAVQVGYFVPRGQGGGTGVPDGRCVALLVVNLGRPGPHVRLPRLPRLAFDEVTTGV
jgi:3-hydroxypropanoate dehydrogenase